MKSVLNAWVESFSGTSTYGSSSSSVIIHETGFSPSGEPVMRTRKPRPAKIISYNLGNISDRKYHRLRIGGPEKKVWSDAELRLGLQRYGLQFRQSCIDDMKYQGIYFGSLLRVVHASMPSQDIDELFIACMDWHAKGVIQSLPSVKKLQRLSRSCSTSDEIMQKIQVAYQ